MSTPIFSPEDAKEWKTFLKTMLEEWTKPNVFMCVPRRFEEAHEDSATPGYINGLRIFFVDGIDWCSINAVQEGEVVLERRFKLLPDAQEQEQKQESA